jgi:hypothetical protein
MYLTYISATYLNAITTYIGNLSEKKRGLGEYYVAIVSTAASADAV